MFFSAVALAAGVDFTTMTPVAERAVGELATFFQSLLDDNARSQVSDVHLLGTRNDSIRDFLQSWLAPHLPNATALFSRDLARQAVCTSKDDNATLKPTSLQPPPTFVSMDIRLSQSQPCGFLKRRRCHTSAADAKGVTSSEPPLPPPAAPPIDDVANLSSTTPVLPLRSLRSRVDAYVASVSSRRPPPKLTFEICIAINRYLAKTSDPNMFHRVPEGGPVTHVFLGRVNARSFLARFTPANVISTLVAPLTHSAYAPASSALQPPVVAK